MMELTDENQDDMDCRPPRETGIPLTPRLRKVLDARKTGLEEMRCTTPDDHVVRSPSVEE
jgi:hypothetical protein